MKYPDNHHAGGENFHAHCFPTLGKQGSDAPDPQDGPCEQFRPSFGQSRDNCGYRPASILGPEPDRNPTDDATHRLQASYQRGLDTGRQDAQCLLHEKIQPDLQGIVEAMRQFSEQLGSMSEAAGIAVISLARKIVQRILGDDLLQGEMDVDVVQGAIADAIWSSYAMELHIHEKDHAYLMAMAGCDPASLCEVKGIRLDGNARVDRGTVDSRETDPWDTLSSQIDQILNHIAAM